MSAYRAFRVARHEDGTFVRSVENLESSDLPLGDLFIEVHYSSLNYKDALSATGAPGVTRNYPHTPGIDVAGVVLESAVPEFRPGDEVIAIGFDLGMNTPGGFGQRVRIPADWTIPMPGGLTLKDCMILGTAGFTAALCLDRLEADGLRPGEGPVLVTGATGGVGCIAVCLLSKLGYEVHAVTGKSDHHGWLRSLGADAIIDRETASATTHRPLSRETWGGCIDTVGGQVLANALKSLRYGKSVAACGLVGGAEFPATVYPFILRQASLLGVDSVQLPVTEKRRIWDRLAGEWRLELPDDLVVPLQLDDLSASIDKILAGQMVGRGLLHLNAQ